MQATTLNTIDAHNEDVRAGHLTITLQGNVEGIFTVNNSQYQVNNPSPLVTLPTIDINTYCTIEFTQSGFEKYTIIAKQPFSKLLDLQYIQALNIGSKHAVQLLSHMIDGNHLHLTFLLEPPCLGLFFDGTGNNLTNDNQFIEDEKEPTNIAKLYELYQDSDHQTKVYIEGIGTAANKQDSATDLALAYSFDERIMLAIKKVQTYFSQTQFALINTGFIDVFGFSRGGAMTRAFINQIHQINQHQPQFFGRVKPVIRFVGPLDTVCSTYGDGDDNHNEYFVSSELPYPVNVDLNAASAGVVYHQVAYDEYRDTFPLHTLQSKNGSTAANITEMCLPGAHADIGGGYGQGDTIIDYPIHHIQSHPNSAKHAEQLARLKEKLEKKYFFPSIDITLTALPPRQRTRSRRFYTPYKPTWQRKINNSLSHYALHQLHDIAIKHGVPFDPIDTLKHKVNSHGQALYQFHLPSKLKQQITRAIELGPDSEAWQTLYKEYIHHSHQFHGVVNKLANSREDSAIHTTENGVREVFYNEPNNAVQNSNPWYAHFNNNKVQWYCSK